MTKYEVSVFETVRHTLTLMANNESDALQEAYDLISELPEAELNHYYDYDSDAEYIGFHEVREVTE